jgi:hypothetical protein
VTGELHAEAAILPERGPRYTLGRRLDSPERQYGHCGEKIILLPLPGIELRPFSP